MIESAVLVHLYNLFGDVENIERAIERATPNLEEVKEKRDELKHLKKKKAKL